MLDILEVRNISVKFGGLSALDGVGFSVPSGSVTALIGPNGAGKTTCFNVISGLQPAKGNIRFDGRDITNVPTHKRDGLGRTFQIVQLFGEMTVKENVMVGLHRHATGGFIDAGLGLPSVRLNEKKIADDVDEILVSMGLDQLANRSAAELPLGQQRLVELARAVATKPRLLMLDECASGLSPSELARLESHITRLVESGLTVLMVEHNMRFVGRLAQHMAVLNFGQVIFEGATSEGLKSPEVIAAYLGKDLKHA